MRQMFDERTDEADLAEPFAAIDPAAFGFDGMFRPQPGLIDADDVDVRPSGFDARFEFAGVAATADAFGELCSALDAAEQAQFATNRAMAAHLDATRHALELASRNPGTYLRPEKLCDPDASELAVRAAATELSMRLRVPVGTIRNRAHEASLLHERLPRLWSRFADGVASYLDAQVAPMRRRASHRATADSPSSTRRSPRSSARSRRRGSGSALARCSHVSTVRRSSVAMHVPAPSDGSSSSTSTTAWRG